MAPQVVNSGYIALILKDKKSCMENYELLQQQWQKNMENLQKMVDESLDCVQFISACEKIIIKETYQTQAAVQEKNNSAIVINTLNIAKRSNRIIQVANQEVENSEDPIYVNRIISANESLRQSLPAMIHNAKSLAVQPNNKEFYLKWADSNEKLINSINNVKNAVNVNNNFVNSINSNRSSSNNDDVFINEQIPINNFVSNSPVHFESPIKLSIDYTTNEDYGTSCFPKIESLRIVEGRTIIITLKFLFNDI